MTTSEITMTLPASKLIKNQKITRTRTCTRTIGNERLTVTIRHDDECGNGHNSFSICGDLYENPLGEHIQKPQGWHWVSGGQITKDIIRFFPDLAPLLKWHLCSTDGPMHYVANSIYHASDKDCWGKRKGEPKSFETVVRFLDVPISHKLPQKFVAWLQSLENLDDLTIAPVHHKTDPKTFKPKYTFSPYSLDTWHTCPFDTEQEAVEWQDALRYYNPQFVSTPTAWGEGKDPDLAAARSCAIWPEAELADFTEEKLLARLPALMADFKAAVESLGLVY